MENRNAYFNLITLVSILTILFGACSGRKCYKIFTEANSEIANGSLVIQDSGIIGELEHVQNSDKTMQADFCTPTGLKIPVDSKIYVGFLTSFALYGVYIRSGSSADYLQEDEVIHAISIDSIRTTSTESDTALSNKIIEIMKDLNSKRRQQKK
jgi:preprotein translocase subunit YajC